MLDRFGTPVNPNTGNGFARVTNKEILNGKEGEEGYWGRNKGESRNVERGHGSVIGGTVRKEIRTDKVR